jgi:hypothetical protein
MLRPCSFHLLTALVSRADFFEPFSSAGPLTDQRTQRRKRP